MQPTNFLKIPAGHFGSAAVAFADSIYKAVMSEDPKIQIDYDMTHKHLVISGVAKIALTQLGEIFECIERASLEGWHPKLEIDQEKILIKFVNRKSIAGYTFD